ncbi:MAG: sensor histidine kinase, partial [Flavisolibacter sp.]
VRYGLDEALKIYCHNISNSNKLVIQYDSWGEFTRYKNSFELSVYRIVQELIANIIKHSKASKALVQMSLLDTILSIDIEDNGIGFSNNNDSKGMGLHTIQSKVKAIDGRIELVSGINKGACAYLEFDISHMKVNQQHE